MKIFKNNPGLVVEFSTANDGNMSYKWGDAGSVEVARRSFCAKLGINVSKVVAISLLHGTKIIQPNFDDAGKGMFLDSAEDLMADGLMTNIPGLGLYFVVADCMPVVLHDPKNKAVALLHAGRRGIEQNILAVTLKKMKNSYGTIAEDVLINVGPSISARSYVFDTDEGVDKEFWGQHFKLGADKKFHMDNKSKFLKQALELGIPKNQVKISRIDTYTNDNFFSHRRSLAKNQPEARFAVLVWLK